MPGLWRQNCWLKRIGSSVAAVLVIDDTAIPKKGTHSVGVAAQYASALGKTANRQTLISLTLARGEVPVMLALRLFLPESWTSKRARLERAGVPAEYRTARTKPEIALAEIDRVIAAGVRFGCVLADAGYGLSAPFRQGLTARKLNWAVGIPRHLKAYPAVATHGLMSSSKCSPMERRKTQMSSHRLTAQEENPYQSHLEQLLRLDRYERGAISRRARALRALFARCPEQGGNA
jgi:SRSO17 transposase